MEWHSRTGTLSGRWCAARAMSGESDRHRRERPSGRWPITHLVERAGQPQGTGMNQAVPSGQINKTRDQALSPFTVRAFPRAGEA
ncbi:hypothetical protein GCM10009850_083220 [Nonomuraea monospora]|uniref:Uncharacterized protein n=1 Tax=Nonomuraea monospora TaxID=568818 RepID=A0ABP5PME6_9ACTN